MRLALLTRRGCHLCDDARAALDELGVAYAIVDVDADVELARVYDFRVPVVLAGDRPVLEGRITTAALRAALDGSRAGLNDLHIALAGPEAAHEIHQLTRAAFSGYHWLTPPSGAIHETEDDVRRDLAAQGGVLARLDGVAVAALRLVAEPGVLRIRRVAVDPGHQGQGLGRELMRWIHRYAEERGFREVRLGVRSQLPGNRAFYEKLGYLVVREHRRPGTEDVGWYEMSRGVGEPAS